ncbi:ribose 5-phosphate isomerase A, partial [Halobium palmae]
MAKQFTYEDGETEISVWAEDRAEVVEEAKRELDDAGVSLSESEIDDHVRVIPSPQRIKSDPEDVLMEMRKRGGMEAAEVVESGMDVGLGTGSTTAWAIAAIGWKLDDGELEDVRGV